MKTRLRLFHVLSWIVFQVAGLEPSPDAMASQRNKVKTRPCFDRFVSLAGHVAWR